MTPRRPRTCRLAHLDDAAIRTAYEAGATTHQLAGEWRCSPQSITNAVLRAGGAMRKQGMPENTKARIAAQRRYERGEGARRIAAALGVSHDRVYQWAKRFGWSRPIGVRVQRDLVVPPSVESRPRRPRDVIEQARTPVIWRCACGARVTNATTCPQGHAAPWAEAA